MNVYTLEEIADILKLTRRTIYTYVDDGKLKAVKMGKFWRVSKENLEAFIKTGTTISDVNRRKGNQPRVL